MSDLLPSLQNELKEAKSAHERYHVTGYCYGDSHADFVARENALKDRIESELKLRDRYSIVEISAL